MLPDFNSQTQLTRSDVDKILNSFLKTGHFILSNGVITPGALSYCINYLGRQPKNFISWDCRVDLKNVTFIIGPLENPASEPVYRDAQIQILLDEILQFSSTWTVIAIDDVAVFHEENYYPLSSSFILYFLARFAPFADGSTELIISKLIVTNAEFHQWAWIKFFIRRPKFRHLTLELLPHEDEADNLMLLTQALHYAKIKVLDLRNTELSLESYQSLNQLLSKNYYIENLQINKPTDPESLVIFKEINQRLSKDRTGEQRFDRERFNQDEFLRLFSEAKNSLEFETDEDKVKMFKKEFKFMLEEKQPNSITVSRERFPLEIELIPKAHAVYYDHAEYILGRLPLFRLNLNRSLDNQANTLGYYLLEEALRNNDPFMMNCLLDNGTANLFEQQDDEKPILMQIYENKDFKKAILKHISSRKTLISMAEEALENYPNSKEIMLELGDSLINYTKRLEKIIYSHNLSNFERLLNRLRERYNLSNPSKQREREFTEIYWRIGKSLILFHNAGNVTVESISNAQSTLDEITAISEHADLGWLRGSKLHDQLTERLKLLKTDMKDNIKSLSSGNVSEEKNKPEKNDSKKDRYLETRFSNFNIKSQNSEVSELGEPGPSTRFSARR
ncbi:MAG TPA: hypothetical protein VGH95_05810 [Candidatus Aquirickettsiella sp.]